MRCVFSESNYGVVLGCAVNQVHSPPSLVNKVRFHHDGPPVIKIFTMLKNKIDAGGA